MVLGPRVVSAEVPETKVCSKLPSLLQMLRRPFAFANRKQRRNFPEKETILEPKPTLRCQKRRKIGFGGASKPKNPQNEAFSKENPALRDTFRSSGVRGMYRGHSLQLAMECVGYSVYFTTYEVSMGMRVRVPLACTLL